MSYAWPVWAWFRFKRDGSYEMPLEVAERFHLKPDYIVHCHDGKGLQ